MLTQKEAWLLIAVAFDNNEKESLLPVNTRYGLCNAAYYLYSDDLVSFETLHKMTDQIRSKCPTGQDYFVKSFNQEARKFRAAKAREFAEELSEITHE